MSDDVRRLAERVETLEQELAHLRQYVAGMDEVVAKKLFPEDEPMMVIAKPSPMTESHTRRQGFHPEHPYQPYQPRPRHNRKAKIMKRELVDIQVRRGAENIGDRYTSQVDHTDPADVRGLYADALKHVGVTGDGYSIQVWRRTGEELFIYPAA